MKISVRNVANLLLGVGVVALTLAVLSQTIINCGTSHCLAASVAFGIPDPEATFIQSYDVMASTPATSANLSSASTSLSEFGLFLGVYTVAIAVLALIALEIIELYYIRRLFKRLGRA